MSAWRPRPDLGLLNLAAHIAQRRGRAGMCEYINTDLECRRLASRVAVFWVADEEPTVRVPVCRSHGRGMRRQGWTVRKPRAGELRLLAEQHGTWRED